MRSTRSLAASRVRCLAHSIAFLTALILVAPVWASGQQQPPPTKKRSPILTSDDVARSRPSQVVVEEAKEEGKEEKAGKPEDAAKADASKADATKAAVDKEKKPDPDEESWRQRVEDARKRLKQAEREAEEGELRITQLRNALASSGTARSRNDAAAAMDEAGRQLPDLRAQAKAAAADLNQLLEHGKEKGYKEPEGPKRTTEDGEANEDYYRKRYAELTEAVQEADRRIELYLNRIRDLTERLSNPQLDRFFTQQLQQERDDAQQKLEEAREARTKAQNDLDTLMSEARQAGVSPSIFR